jgi:prolyl-tRNA synthetase
LLLWKLNISVKLITLLKKPGFKFAEWELKGVPVRIAVGPKENGTLRLQEEIH